MTRERLDTAGGRRILIVDDHPIVREGISQFLSLQDNLHPCCEAAGAEDALRAMDDCRHDLSIVDLSLNNDSGLELIKVLRHRYPELAILAISMHDESLFAERALNAGANGYLMKQEGTANILLAVRQVLAGHVYLSAAMHGKITQRLVAPQSVASNPLAGLTDREFEIMHLIALGFGTREISEKLNRSIKTIEAHRANLRKKLELKNSRDLVRFAIQYMEAGKLALPSDDGR